ncbi:MAG: D-2-hydroxyacid dehydrogenase family protein [Steroidobacteraceae bacterium]|jgi:phosphoglycerate dehydrogenase-like enzyme
MLKIGILDDYARIALNSADWSRLPAGTEITVFDRHLTEEEAATELLPFEVLCTVRERMALPRSLLQRLPRLKLLTIVGMSLPNLDMAAATALGIVVSHSDFQRAAFAKAANATPELAWGLMIATVRHIAHEDRRLREGGWQSSIGIILAGRTLGLLGLGRIGKRMAEYGRVFGMEVIAWSQNLTAEAASAAGVRRVEKDELFRSADILSIHLQLSDRTRGLVSARELALMKPEAHLVNTSRGPIVDEAALLASLKDGRLAGAGLDVFDVEPLPPDHPWRSLGNVTLTPHLGYVTAETLRAFYGDMPEAIAAFASGTPIRVANPDVLRHRAAAS